MFNLFSADSQLKELLLVTADPDIDIDEYYNQLNDRIRRSQNDPTLITEESLPFISIAFIDSKETKNYLVNKGVLEIEIFAPNRYIAKLISDRTNDLLKATFEDFKIISEGQKYSGLQNIYCYCIRYMPLISS